MNSFVSEASLLGLSEPAHGLRTLGQDRADLAEQLLGRDAGLARDGDLVESPLLLEEPLRRRQIEPRQGRAADREVRAELDDPRDPQRRDRPLDLNPDLVADREVLLVGDPRVDHDLVRAGPGALDEPQRVERRLALGDREAEVRSAPEDDRLVVLPDQRGRVAVDAALGLRDAVEPAHLVEQRVVERRLGDAAPVAQVEGRLAGDDDVGALAHVGEDLVERAVDRVRQHVRAADHRDAEHDRERGQRGAQLPREEPFERELDHGSVVANRPIRNGALRAGSASQLCAPA